MTGILFSAVAIATPMSTTLKVIRDGLFARDVRYNFWSNEYPSPVIDSNAKIAGTTKITVEQSLRHLGQVKACTVKNGLYHPWSKTGNSVLKYISLVPLTEYRVRRSRAVTILDETGSTDLMVHRGDYFTRVIYLSEGFCSAEYVNLKLERKDVDVECTTFDDSVNFARTSRSAPAVKDETVTIGEQWLLVSCAEGYLGYIRDEAFLATPTVKPGVITSYGTVGSDGDPK